MKILMILDNEFPPDIRVEKEAESLISQGHSVTILSYNFKGLNKTELWKGIRIIRFKINKQLAKKTLGFSLQLPFYKWIWQFQINRILKSDKYDAVHIHDLPLCCLIQSVKTRFNIPVIADMHENYPFLVAEQPYMNSLFAYIFLSKKRWFIKEKEWLGKASAIICVAEEMKQRIKTDLIDTLPVILVPNTPSIPELNSSMTDHSNLKERFAGTFIILYIGGIDPVRGIDILIQAARFLIPVIPQFKIVIVGDGKLLPDLKQLAKSLQLGNNIVFDGWIPQDKIGSYISVSDVCVIPHRKSPQTDNSSPNKLFQYFYFKKPVISSDCNSIEKIILTEKCGMIYHDNLPEELAAKIKYLYNNPKTGIEMGNNGYNAVVNKYNWESTVTSLLSLYADLNL
jgi:glycosyltransferase involved in cell wall biosynthesis